MGNFAIRQDTSPLCCRCAHFLELTVSTVLDDIALSSGLSEVLTWQSATADCGLLSIKNSLVKFICTLLLNWKGEVHHIQQHYTSNTPTALWCTWQQMKLCIDNDSNHSVGQSSVMNSFWFHNIFSNINVIFLYK